MLKMRTRKLIIWLGLIVLGVPIAIVLLGDVSPIVENLELIAAALMILTLSVTSWRLKKRLKGRMERGLGRKIQDEDLTSITAWMRIPDQAARAAKEAEKYDFND